MTIPADFRALADELEHAEQGSRELSDRVLLACGEALPPDPTHSLDAALRWVVPEGAIYVLQNMRGGRYGGFCKLAFHRLPIDSFHTYVDVSAKTTQLAVCAAGLRARAEMIEVSDA